MSVAMSAAAGSASASVVTIKRSSPRPTARPSTSGVVAGSKPRKISDGGGLFLLRRMSDHKETMVDARETAPIGVDPKDYLKADGTPDRDH